MADMFCETGRMPDATSLTFRLISSVAEPCSLTAPAIVVVYSETSSIVFAISVVTSTVSVVDDCVAPICAEISSAAFAVCPASVFTSDATTAFVGIR